MKKYWESDHGCRKCRDGYLHVYAFEIPHGNRVRVFFRHNDHELEGNEIEYMGRCGDCFSGEEDVMDPDKPWKFVKNLDPKTHNAGVSIPRDENVAMIKQLNIMVQQPTGVVNWETETKKKERYHEMACEVCARNSHQGLSVRESQEIRSALDIQYGTWENQYEIPF